MEVNELWHLTRWIQKHVQSTKVAKRYAALLSVLNNNIQANQPKQAVEQAAKHLIEGLNQMPMQELTRAERDFLERIGLDGLLGSEGAQLIQDSLYVEGIDPATAVTRIQEAQSRTNNALAKIDQLRTGLEGTVTEDSSAKGEAIVRVTFDDRASIHNVVDLKEWASAWHDIARGVAMAIGEAPEAVRVVGASRGSFVLDLAMAYGVAKLVAYIFEQSLSAAVKLQEIRLASQQIDNLKLTNAGLAADLERKLQQAADEEKELRVEKIAGEIIHEQHLDQNGSGDKVVALERSVRLAVEFVDKGGDVDLVIDETDGEAQNEGQAATQRELQIGLRQSAAQIRRLEEKLKQLEHKAGAGGSGTGG